MLRIRSKTDGFRRCGVPHSSEWKEHPDGAFTPEQVDILKAEPMLQVEAVAPKKQNDNKPAGNADGVSEEDMTKAQIIARLTELGVEVPKTANKPELQALLEEALAEAAKKAELAEGSPAKVSEG